MVQGEEEGFSVFFLGSKRHCIERGGLILVLCFKMVQFRTKRGWACFPDFGIIGTQVGPEFCTHITPKNKNPLTKPFGLIKGKHT